MLEKIEKPEIETAELKNNGTYGKFILEPLERGYGTTLGNTSEKSTALLFAGCCGNICKN